MSFTLLQTYKVLKPRYWTVTHAQSFTLLQTYKVLKPQIILQGYLRTLTYWQYAVSLYQK